MGKFKIKALIHNSFLKHRYRQDEYKTSATQLVFLDNKQQKKVTLRKPFACLAQSVEHAAVNRSVVGSSPTTGATLKRKPQKENSKKNKKFLTDEYA